LKESLIEKNTNATDHIKNFEGKKPEPPKETNWEIIKNNLQSGITVGLVNLSLCISLAVASGSTPGVGIIAGIYAGITSGFIGGSHFNIIGPTGALSSFVKKLIFKYGESSLPFSCLVVALSCFSCRFLALDKYIDLFPVPVTEGFTVGVALILFINQISPALGMENYNPEASIYNGEETQFSNSLIHNLVVDFENLHEVNISALITFCAFLAFLGFCTVKFPKFPSVILATLLGMVLGYLQSIGISPTTLNTLETKYGQLEMSFFTFPTNFKPLANITFYIDCLPIAVIAILETLISAKIADKMTKTRFDKNQETVCLGVANGILGLVGGLPVTAALARTSLNIKTGATHRISSLINSVIIILFSLFFFDKFKYLPICVIGSIVSIVAFKMVSYHEVIHYYQQDFKSFTLIMVGGIVSLLVDPTYGLVVAMIVYFFMFTTPFLSPFFEVIYTKSKIKKGKYILSNLDQHLQDIPVGVKVDQRNFVVYRFIGILNYMNIDYHEKRIIDIMESEPDICLILSLRYIYKIDIDTLDSLKILLDNVESYDKEFFSTNRFILSGITSTQINEVKDPEWFKTLVSSDKLVLSEEFDSEVMQIQAKQKMYFSKKTSAPNIHIDFFTKNKNFANSSMDTDLTNLRNNKKNGKDGKNLATMKLKENNTIEERDEEPDKQKNIKITAVTQFHETETEMSGTGEDKM